MDNFNRSFSVKQQDLKKFFDFFRGHYKINQIQAQIIDGDWTRIAKKDLFETPRLISRIAINNARFKNAFIVDCDHENMMGWIGNVPPPTYTVKNIVNDKHHHVWLLEDPVPLTGKYNQIIAQNKTLRYIENIEEGLCLALDGDPDYRGKNSKNPLNTDLYQILLWDQSTPLYHLNDFKDIAIKGLSKNRHNNLRIDENRVQHGRNSRIFEYTRLSAYALARRYKNDPKGLLQSIVEIAEAYNSEEKIPLPGKEISHIAKSIWKYILAGKSPVKMKKVLTDEEKASNRRAGQQRRRAREIASIEKQWRFYTFFQLTFSVYKYKKQAQLRTIEKNGNLYTYKPNPSSICVSKLRRRQPETQRDALRYKLEDLKRYKPPPDYLDHLISTMTEKEREQLRYEAGLAFP